VQEEEQRSLAILDVDVDAPIPEVLVGAAIAPGLNASGKPRLYRFFFRCGFTRY
jgi:hypothetical protein